MPEFIDAKQIDALSKVIARARTGPGVHREPTPDGEAIAYAGELEIHWCVNADERNVARGTVPKKEGKRQ